jgi:hypothetical protein
MHWDWVSFAVGIITGGIGGLALAGLGLWAFAKGMSDE